MIINVISEKFDYWQSGEAIMEGDKVSGSCLCGVVTYQFTGPVNVFQYCHCSRCRKFTGSAHATNIIISPDQFQWLSGEESIGRYEHPQAKHFATSFCKNCGSSLPWLAKSGKAVVVTAGTLDDDPEVKPIHNVFMADMAPWYEEVGDLIKHEALPVRS
jgi:hypothetical protein